MRSSFSFLVLLGCITFASAQTRPNADVLTTEWEIWQEKVPISGNIRVGLMVDTAIQDFNPNEFYVLLPPHTSSNLCVELSSKDGRYSANINYDISTLQPGRQLFLLPTKYSSELSDFKTDELVILASLNNVCDVEPEAYVLCGWVNSTAIQSASVYINTTSPATLILKRKDASEQEFKCVATKSPSVAFSKTCSLPVASLTEDTDLTVRLRVRRGGKSTFKPLDLPLKYFLID